MILYHLHIFEENILIENGFIGKESTKIHLYVSPTNQNTKWANDYLFDYDNIEMDKQRLLQLLNIAL